MSSYLQEAEREDDTVLSVQCSDRFVLTELRADDQEPEGHGHYVCLPIYAILEGTGSL